MIYRNNKNQKCYRVIGTGVINATNDAKMDDGQPMRMVLYKDIRGTKYVREYEEFFEKFTKTDFEKIPE